ncbi:MAG: NAD(P)/FAD-dependent oxidoreductase [Pseudomonadota bacterium]
MATRIAIVGAGPGGLLLARLLQMRGVTATVFERDPDAHYRPQGGSLDLHVDTGQRALRLGGLYEAFLSHARPEDQGDRLYDCAGALLFDHAGDDFERPEIDRTALRDILLASLKAGTVRDARVTEVRAHSDGAHEVLTQDGPENFDIVIGADGAWSRVRPLLSSVEPRYEGVVFVELGFNTATHPFVDALTGAGKMFAVGENRALVAQRNGHDHIRGYAGWRTPEFVAKALAEQPAEHVRAAALQVFENWAPTLTEMIQQGAFLGVRPLYALPVGHCWTSRAGFTLLGDAAHLMSPFAGEGVNLALADAADLAEALTSEGGWMAIAHAEAVIADRAKIAAVDSAEGLRATFSAEGVAQVLQHYRARLAGE